MNLTDEGMAKEIDNDFEGSGRLREIKKQRNRKMKNTLAIAGCAVLFLLLMIGSVVLYLWLDGSMKEAKETSGGNVEVVAEDEIVFTQTELDEYVAKAIADAEEKGAQKVLDSLEEGVNSGETLVEVLRTLYADKMVVASNGKYHFVPINESLKQNNLAAEGLMLKSDGTVEYVENGQVISYKGIDVSKHQGEIDWAKVAADGVKFAFIRVGNRGYGSGAIVEDAQFEANIKGAISNGIQVGVYFFSQAINEQEAMEEAKFVLDKIAPYKVQCPIVIDVEKVADSEARMNKISSEQRTANTLVFLQAVEDAGYEAMLYHNMEMGLLMLDLAQFEEYNKWFAYYNKEIYYPYAFDVWQYSDKGKVNGINGDVDLNISFKLWD
ncbi:MAG: glycoside hydrolase family 25 protein [Lachnospiraceae bacterium]|nr:glycoside hydrolase family 25 protein [Lachnospiraceae bacterium]